MWSSFVEQKCVQRFIIPVVSDRWGLKFQNYVIIPQPTQEWLWTPHTHTQQKKKEYNSAKVFQLANFHRFGRVKSKQQIGSVRIPWGGSCSARFVESSEFFAHSSTLFTEIRHPQIRPETRIRNCKIAAFAQSQSQTKRVCLQMFSLDKVRNGMHIALWHDASCA